MMFSERLAEQIDRNTSHVCVGLDTDPEAFGRDTSNILKAFLDFNQHVIDATIGKQAAYKLNMSFYAAYGLEGYKALQETVRYIRSKDKNAVILSDSKRSEMKRSAEMVAREIFEYFDFDGIIVTPWFGYDTLEPYGKYPEKGVFVLCHDSNPSAGELQDVELKDGNKMFEHVTKLLVNSWSKQGNVHIEGPLTYPDILKRIIEIGGLEQTYLAAGLGAQGGDINDLAMFKGVHNFIVNASRSILTASTGHDFAEAAGKQTEEYRTQINDIVA